MTVVIPVDHHARGALENRGIVCLDSVQAARQDIRALRIGILNIMPKAETYEFNLLYPLGRSILQIEPVWIRLKTHTYSSTDKEHLDRLYVSFEEAVAERDLDGLIITGAPVEDIPFEEIKYWEELTSVIRYAREHIHSTLGICWGAMALGKFLGMNTMRYPSKLFGVYPTQNLNSEHPITGELDEVFWVPQSRHAGIADELLELERDKGTVNLLAWSESTGYTIFESADRRFIGHLGHPEYNSRRLVEEYQRDVKLGRTDVLPPANFDVDKPRNTWRANRMVFFNQWIRFIYNRTSFAGGGGAVL